MSNSQKEVREQAMQINGVRLYRAEEQLSQRPCSGSKLGVLVYWGHQKGQYGLRRVKEWKRLKVAAPFPSIEGVHHDESRKTRAESAAEPPPSVIHWELLNL